jgi:hypothetical protein
MPDIFGDIRSTLHGEPDARRWGDLCALLDRVDDRERLAAEIVPYVEGVLEAWDDDLRRIPPAWLDRALDGAPVPQLAIGRILEVRGRRIGDRGARALAQLTGLGGLYRLDLAENRIGPEGARALAEADHLDGLLFLALDDNPIGADGARALADAPQLRSLLWLDLCVEDIGRDGVAALARSEHLRAVVRRAFSMRLERVGSGAFYTP